MRANPHRSPIHAAALGLFTLGILAGACPAQDSAKTIPTPMARPAGATDVLGGPKVVEQKATPTIVHRDMNGEIEVLDTRPEQAALDVLGLTPGQRHAPDEIITRHTTEVSKLLRERYSIFIKIQGARQAGAKPEELRPLMREFRPFAEPILRPSLEDRVAEALPEDRRTLFHSLVGEYKQALASMNRPGAQPDTKPGVNAKPDAFAAERAEMNLLLREMARSLKAITDERKEHMDAFLKAIDATPEQESQIRAMTRAAAESKRDHDGALKEPTPEERAANWRRIMDLLTPEQRQKAIEARRNGL